MGEKDKEFFARQHVAIAPEMDVVIRRKIAWRTVFSVTAFSFNIFERAFLCERRTQDQWDTGKEMRRLGN